MHKNFKSGQPTSPEQEPGDAIVFMRIAVLTVFIGSLAFAGPLIAAPEDTPEVTPAEVTAQPSAPTKHHEMRERPSQTMAKHVETRIKTLHDKLGITSEQETKWSDVALTMRSNENVIVALIETRRKNVDGMTAIDDLQSYEEITQAHADGIKKLIVSFQVLYVDMSDAQKNTADKVFGRFEGHHTEKRA